jgi:hypothetical protein
MCEGQVGIGYAADVEWYAPGSWGIKKSTFIDPATGKTVENNNPSLTDPATGRVIEDRLEILSAPLKVDRIQVGQESCGPTYENQYTVIVRVVGAEIADAATKAGIGTLIGLATIAGGVAAAAPAPAVDWAVSLDRAHDKGCRGAFRYYHVRCEFPDRNWCDKCADMPFDPTRRLFNNKQMLLPPGRLADRAWAEVAVACQ